MCSAVGKSGSPISRWMILPPAASMACARARTSKADSVPSLAMRSASRTAVMAPMISRGQIDGKRGMRRCGMSDGPVSDRRDLDARRLFAAAESDFARYEVVKDLVDECIDLALNYRQSGHPGGSRS